MYVRVDQPALSIKLNGRIDRTLQIHNGQADGKIVIELKAKADGGSLV